VLSLFPESPRFSYSIEDFEKAKDSLEAAAKVNGTTKFNKNSFKFDTEKAKEELEEGKEKAEGEKKDGGNEYGISEGEFVRSLILMCLLFTCFSFSFWLVDFQTEYLGTDIYLLFYINGIVCIVSGQINLLLYERLGMKVLVLIVQAITVLSSAYIICVQQRVFEMQDPEQQLIFVNVSIVVALMLLNLSIQVGFTAVVQSAY
jgi:cation transport ATPase